MTFLQAMNVLVFMIGASVVTLFGDETNYLDPKNNGNSLSDFSFFLE